MEQVIKPLSDEKAEELFDDLVGAIRTLGVTQKSGTAVPVRDGDTYTDESVTAWLAAEADGKVYGVEVPLGKDTKCVKTGANAGIQNPVPGIVGRPCVDPYNGRGVFRHYDVACKLGTDGKWHVSKFAGEPGYDPTGADGTEIFVLRPNAWYSWDEDGVGRFAMSDQWHLGMSPAPGVTCSDGSTAPFVLLAKYGMSKGADGKPHTRSGQPLWRFVSHDSLIDVFEDTSMCPKTNADDWWAYSMLLLKYATKNSQSVFAGCCSYDAFSTVATAESATTRVLVPKADGDKFLVGSSVMVGSSATKQDRGDGNAHDVVDSAVITSKDAVGDNVALVLDTAPFDVAAGDIVQTAPWHAGCCDAVEGDGSPTSCTDNKQPFVLDGVEMAYGCYEVIGNTVAVSDGDGWHVMCNAVYANEVKDKASEQATDIGVLPLGDANVWHYPLYASITNGHYWMPVGDGASTSTGTADGVYTYARTVKGAREIFSLGYLWSGSFAGLRYVSANGGTAVAGWACGSRPSVMVALRGESA